MLNIEKYENELRKYGVYFGLTKEGNPVDCKDIQCVDCTFHGACTIKRMNWLLEEYKEPILNEKEKEILNKLIEGNRDTVNINLVYVKKVNLLYDNNKCYLCFAFENRNESYTVTFNKDCIFKGMEVDKEYSLEELGLC